MSDWIPPNAEYPPPKAGEPALHRAARVGDGDAIRRLVADGHDVDAVFDIGLDPGCAGAWLVTPLMVAAGSGDGASVETVELLLSLGAEPARVERGRSAAVFACAGLGFNYRPGGDAPRLERLLAAGCPLPPSPTGRRQLLCDAARSGDAGRLSLLLAHGLDARGHWDADEARAKHQAMSEEMAKVQAQVLAGLPDFVRESLATSDAMPFAREPTAPSSFEIPLFCAAESGSGACVRLLLEAGADPMVRDDARRTALYCASSADAVRELLSAGLPLEDADQFGWSPLVNALCDGADALPTVRALIDAGADVNATHDRGYTVFMSAVGSERDVRALEMLIDAGADPHALSDLGFNAFHAALDVNGEANAVDSVRATLSYLKSLAIEIEHRNDQGQTPLARAIDEGTGTEVRELCTLGADPNVLCPMHRCGDDGCGLAEVPLLHSAADGPGVHGVEKTAALLEAGADPLARDGAGFTALERVASSLCSDAPDYEHAYASLFERLDRACARDDDADNDNPPDTRGAFFARVEPRVQSTVTELAADIPVGTGAYDAAWRQEQIACIVLLGVHEAWAGGSR